MNPLIKNREYAQRHTVMNPTNTGSVGDVLPVVRLKQSSPDLPARYMDVTRTPGSYISTGLRVIDNQWTGKRSFKTNIGWEIQDLQENDLYVEPYVGSLGNFGWRNKVANIYESRRTGELFLPLPGRFGLTSRDVPRGGNVMRVTDIAGEELPFESVVFSASNSSRQGLQNPSQRYGK
jgi:hypothetical protein